MASILTHAIISDAISAIETYESTCNNIYDSFQDTINTLTSSNWNGDGADGCKQFFNTTVTSGLKEGITSMTTTLKQMLTNIQETLLDNVDPQLGDNNRNSGSSE